MRRLLIVRHAKSSWDHPGLRDFERPLNPRGRRAAPEMARRLAACGVRPDWVRTSPAVRARQTVDLMQPLLAFDPAVVEGVPDLYGADPEEILAEVRSAPAAAGTLMIVGHNPGLTGFSNLVSDRPLDNIPTAGVHLIGFDVADWTRAGRGVSLLYDFPGNPHPDCGALSP